MYTTWSPRTFWYSSKLYLPYDTADSKDCDQVSFAEANLIGSLLENGCHAPALDIDWCSDLDGDELTIWFTQFLELQPDEVKWCRNLIIDAGLVRELELITGPDDQYELKLSLAYPATLLESKTPGHYHLYVDMELDWETYLGLINALHCLGILQLGFLKASESRQMTCLRKLPIVGQQVLPIAA